MIKCFASSSHWTPQTKHRTLNNHIASIQKAEEYNRRHGQTFLLFYADEIFAVIGMGNRITAFVPPRFLKIELNKPITDTTLNELRMLGAADVEEFNFISEFYPSLNQISDWPVLLSEWKLEKGVRLVTRYQAKRFANYLLSRTKPQE